jgi:hypothetical protein
MKEFRMMQKKGIFIAAVLIFVSSLSVSASTGNAVKDKQKPAGQLDKATTDLVTAANQYKTSVSALVPVYEAALKSAQESLEKRKELFDQGIISRRDLEAGEQAVNTAKAQLDDARKQVTESDQILAEARAPKAKILIPSIKSGGYTTASAIIRSGGAAGWSLTQASMVQNFFSATFGRALPVSAYGQSATHDRMGFNHRNSLDVAVHPDSAEGKALIAYLRGNGIPFLAFRSAVPGAATGAHIHIGYPSHRI